MADQANVDSAAASADNFIDELKWMIEAKITEEVGAAAEAEAPVHPIEETTPTFGTIDKTIIISTVTTMVEITRGKLTANAWIWNVENAWLVCVLR